MFLGPVVIILLGATNIIKYSVDMMFKIKTKMNFRLVAHGLLFGAHIEV